VTLLETLPHRQASLLSVVIPCFNEADVIPEAHGRLLAALGQAGMPEFELIYVDDGSTDATLALLSGLASGDQRVGVVSLARNFGHQMAVTAGLEQARGDLVVLIDADLQDPPELIADMLAKWQQGADVVYGVRLEREGETRFKRWTARLFYRFLDRLAEVPMPLDTGDFRLMDRLVVDALLQMPERDRFIRGMVAWVGFRQEPLHYQRAARAAGTSKYPLTKMIRLASDGILSFSLAPLRIATWLGFFSAGLAVFGILYALVLRLLTDIWVPGWTLMFISVMFIGGVQLMFLGIIGEYLGRVYGEVKRRPLYIVKRRLGAAAARQDDPDRR